MPWRKVRFKADEVLARCSAAGELIAQGGRVEIRYKPRDARTYRASVHNLEPITPLEIIADEVVVAEGPRTSGAVGSDEGAIIVYADGACSGNPGPAGVGIVLIDGPARRELSHYLGEGTNNIAELTAIELALTEIGDGSRRVRLHTDSQYAIGVLTKGWKAKANVELVTRLRARVAAFSDLQLRYVRGHSGVPLNERADTLAVQAVSRRTPGAWVAVTPATPRPSAS